MNNQKANKFVNINFNLKNEIFSYFHIVKIIKFIPICKAFKFSVENLKWFKIIAENFEELLSKAKLYYNDMKEIIEILISKGLMDSLSFQLCVYLLVMKIKNQIDFSIDLSKISRFESNREFLKFLYSFSKSIIKLDLSWNDLGYNENKIIGLKEALKIPNSIKQLDLSSNNLGWIENNMICLKATLKINNSIQELNLNFNFLGCNENNILHLKEGLRANNSIKQLHLKQNDLGCNENNLSHLGELLENNCSINQLDLTFNHIGCNENNMLYLKNALKINKSIQQLNLRDNELG